MKKVILRSTIIGFILGTLFFALAPLGLGLSLFEILKPVLVPGVYFVQFAGINTVGLLPMALALSLNVVIYSILVMSIFYLYMHIK